MYVHLLSKYMNMHEFGLGIHLKLQVVSMADCKCYIIYSVILTVMSTLFSFRPLSTLD